MTLIATTKDLKTACAALKKEDFITVDTEFIRERTYWAKLCLIQVGGEEAAYAIDPLAPGIDLKPLYDLLRDPKILKVFHACRQDLEIFLKEMGEIPAPVFDTQIAAMVCGFGEQVGYEALVNKILKRTLDKSSRFTDWAQRPLTPQQMKYALADVTHLRPIYTKLRAKIEKLNRADWIREDMEQLTDPKNYVVDPDEMWQRLRIPSNKPRVLGVLKAVAAWREHEAQAANVPRPRVLKDDAIVEIALNPPTTREKMDKLRSLHQGYANSDRGQRLLNVIKEALSLQEVDCPKRRARTDFPSGLGPTVDLLRVLLKFKCEQNEVASKLVALSEDIEHIAAFGEKADVPALKGWRRDLYGEDALALRSGKIALALSGSSIKIVSI